MYIFDFKCVLMDRFFVGISYQTCADERFVVGSGSLKDQTLQKAGLLRKDGDVVVYMNATATCTKKAWMVVSKHG